MELPKDFCDLMRQQYGDEMAESLFKGLSQEPSVSIRLNPKKIHNSQFIIDFVELFDLHNCPASVNENGTTPSAPFAQPNYELCIMNYELEKVAWCPDAYYLNERPAFTFDPLFHAGVYYVQEASSMYLATILEKHLLDKCDQSLPFMGEESRSDGEGLCLSCLDLCAAPGGKSTLLRSLLPDDCLLVSNEPMPKRAQVLAENMTKWGHPNCIVTQNYPADFTFLTDAFDLIVTDVPCSGEGMFRKDEGAIRDWSMENVDTCWRRQRSILTDIWPTLKPGGLLVYSTCTFNHFEDEDNVAWIAEHLGAEVLEQRHFLPGRDKGEGFFIAALRKHTQTEDPLRPTATSPFMGRDFIGDKAEGTEREQKNDVARKIKRNLKILFSNIEEEEPERKYGRKVEQKHDRKTERKHGKSIGRNSSKEDDKQQDVPHALALSTTYQRGTYPEYELTYDEALAYLRREALRIKAPRGIVLVTFKGVPLGFVKSVGNRANNLYPQEWRIRTTYTTPFCLFAEEN